MCFPVRCYTCGKVIRRLEVAYNAKKKAGTDVVEILHELGVRRYCCRRMFLSYTEPID
jgi:DNA-directed RNA polymerase subunit N